MRMTMRESNTFLTHTFGQGLEDERYAVERFKSTMDGDIRPLPAGESTTKGRRRAKRATATRKAVRREAVTRFPLRFPVSPAGTGLMSPSADLWRFTS